MIILPDDHVVKKFGEIFVDNTICNTGCLCFLGINILTIGVEFGKIRGKALEIGDTTATCFYQSKEFITGDHMVVIRADSWLNKYTGLFVVAILQNEQYKYSYGRAYLMDRIKDTTIKLPIDSDGNPDWQFMENYMKALPGGDRLEG